MEDSGSVLDPNRDFDRSVGFDSALLREQEVAITGFEEGFQKGDLECKS